MITPVVKELKRVSPHAMRLIAPTAPMRHPGTVPGPEPSESAGSARPGAERNRWSAGLTTDRELRASTFPALSGVLPSERPADELADEDQSAPKRESTSRRPSARARRLLVLPSSRGAR